MKIEICKPAPVLNTPDFAFAFGGKTGSEIPLDNKGHPYHFEFVALPGTVFQVRGEIPQADHLIFCVETERYPHSPLYIDSRFAQEVRDLQLPTMPSKETILASMVKLTGTPYVWGGNWHLGIPEMLRYYPPSGPIDPKTETYWTMKGVDCSGLLYQTSNGLTPRNTSGLIKYGKSININDLQPLDLIIYPGHVIFVLDSYKTIESKFPFGVIQRGLQERIGELLSERKWVEEWDGTLDPAKHFMTRRIF